MAPGNNCIRETHYEILSVKEDASYEDIRTSYRSAILNSHPDKLQATSESGDRFLKVQKAWEILSNQRSRALYDNMLIASRHDTFVADDISLEDVMAEDAGEVIQLFHQCRCGDYYFVDSSELEKMGYALLRDGSRLSIEAQNALPASLVLPCGSCSLKVPRKWVPPRKAPNGEAYSTALKLKTIPSMPEALMAEINTAMCNLEYARATALLESTSPSSSSFSISKNESSSSAQPQFDARKADQAYKAGCAALAAGKLDEALLSLNVSLSKCPPTENYCHPLLAVSY